MGLPTPYSPQQARLDLPHLSPSCVEDKGFQHRSWNVLEAMPLYQGEMTLWDRV